MIHLTATACIDASAERVWDVLARLEDIALWSEPVLAARCAPGRARGVGAERVCDLRGGLTIVETWLAWEEGRSFTYEGSGIPLVARARNTWSVEPHGEQSLLRSEAEVALRGGLVGRLLEPLVAWQSRRLGRRALAAFAYLVEHGEPPAIRHARLAPARVAC
ncbi:MAG: SRPBCC family protein [Thermoleophilia bacterium]